MTQDCIQTVTLRELIRKEKLSEIVRNYIFFKKYLYIILCKTVTVVLYQILEELKQMHNNHMFNGNLSLDTIVITTLDNDTMDITPGIITFSSPFYNVSDTIII